jgi:integrase
MRFPELGEETRWEAWVPKVLEFRYSKSPNTHLRYSIAWKTLQVYLRRRRLQTPADVRYGHCVDYIDWRTTTREKGIYRAGKNSALTELKVLGLLLQEAVRRGFIVANPARGLNISRDPVRQKSEITVQEEARIREELAAYPEWMRVSFEIAMATGCRMRETPIDFNDIDLDRRIVSFVQKGGRRHATALPPHIVPMLRDLKVKGLQRTCELPPFPAKHWWSFFRRIGLPHLSFHSTRVSVVTRLARAGVSERIAMRFVGHASTTVHRIYTRLTVSDLDPCVAVIGDFHARASSISSSGSGSSTSSSGSKAVSSPVSLVPISPRADV